MPIFSIFNSIYNTILLTALVIGVVKYKNLTKSLRLVLLFVVFGCVTETSTDIMKYFGMRNTMPAGNIYIPVVYIILGLFYITVLKEFVKKKILIGIIVAYEFLCIINLIFIQKLLEFPNITAAIGAFIVIIFSILLFSKVLSEAKIEKLSKEPIIWINTAFLIYYSANFFFYILFNVNVEFSLEFAKRAHLIYAGFNILLYAVIAFVFLKVKSDNKV